MTDELQTLRAIIRDRWFEGWVPKLEQRAWRTRGVFERGIEIIPSRSEPMTDVEYDYLQEILDG